MAKTIFMERNYLGSVRPTLNQRVVRGNPFDTGVINTIGTAELPFDETLPKGWQNADRMSRFASNTGNLSVRELIDVAPMALPSRLEVTGEHSDIALHAGLLALQQQAELVGATS